MRIREVSDHAFQLTRMGLVNCYLLRESDGYTLIDTGIGGSAEAILVAARKLGVAMEIQRVLLTHAHADHIGSLDQLCHLLGNADVAIGAREARLLPKKPAQDRSRDENEPQGKLKGMYPGATSQPTHLVSDGELYGSLRCLATPGHTPGHFSFLDERDGTLYCGDAMTTVGGHLHISGWAPWYFPLPNFATWDKPTNLETARKLFELASLTQMEQVAPGHGPVCPLNSKILAVAIVEAEHTQS
ncbi:Glyoxylase, beta-lactamase superfamily II [Bryocella elongata]|uniref:Glyoxylase, beta-lactamase superfamily II n=1 Tax=Bryocella elongata TaxID=863522 RepID=A0A1H5YBF0_9BACT|nr:MBL fold metallo-hydrolase [Bryocella elongata]SEG20977.1 Glyoxylase, beta-lactamase superfamily II [Bryocella elongata]